MGASKAPRIRLSEYLPQLKEGDRSPVLTRVQAPGPNTFSGLIVVEGPDDASFIDKLYLKGGPGYAFMILDGLTSQKLIDLKKLYLDRLLSKTSNILKKVSFIIDADQDFTARTRELTAFLKTLDPTWAASDIGQVRPSSYYGLHLGAFCLPDNQSGGELEDLAWPACCDGFHSALVTDYFDQVAANRERRSLPPLVKMAKRRMQAYLATQQPHPIGSNPVCNGVGFALDHGLIGIEDETPLAALKTFMTQFMDA